MDVTEQNVDTIDGSGFPLAFKVRQGSARPGVLGTTAARDVFVAEARALTTYQKEAVVAEGATGSSWRMTTDEGRHIKGTDLAPFPLGFFNAALHGDLTSRLLSIAAARSLGIDDLSLRVQNFYALDGSFARGDAIGRSFPAKVVVRLESGMSATDAQGLVDAAVQASPALAAMRTKLTNTFAIYVNGRRRVVTALANSDAPDAADPYRTYTTPPAPLAGNDDLPDLIEKTGEVQAGDIVDVSDGSIRKVRRTVTGESASAGPACTTATDTWLELPGVSHFTLKSDERTAIGNGPRQVGGDQGPSGLALLSAGIVFCYMTQLTRYIENQHFDIRGVRLVQYTPWALIGSATGGDLTGVVEPVDTHLFLSGDARDEDYERLMTIAASTCYLHATLADTLVPEVAVELNGTALG
jgi:uncharacterized OsmC-like protein